MIETTARSHARSRAGFTLIELLVVMGILSALAGLGIVGIPTYIRAQDRTVCQARLGQIGKDFKTFLPTSAALPNVGGPELVLSMWNRSDGVDHTEKDATERYFCPSLGNGAPEEGLELDEAVTPGRIHFTAVQKGDRKFGIKPSRRNANEFILMCNKVPNEVETDDDMAEFPHAGKGICYLTLGGSTGWIAVGEFEEGYVVIGPDSSNERFLKLDPVWLEDD